MKITTEALRLGGTWRESVQYDDASYIWQREDAPIGGCRNLDLDAR